MTYSPGIPNSNDLISQSQAQIKTNFTNIDSATIGFAVDHVTLTDNTNGGKHKQVTFNSNNVPGSFPVSPPVLFTNNDAFSTPQLFYYSGSAAKSSSQYVAAASGSTYLLGGIILKWGTYSLAPGVATTAVTFAGGGFPNNIFSLTFGTNTSGTPNNCPIWVDGTLTTSGFTGGRVTGSSGGTYTYKYIAIGN
jgi:hypothetical protein